MTCVVAEIKEMEESECGHQQDIIVLSYLKEYVDSFSILLGVPFDYSNYISMDSSQPVSIRRSVLCCNVL